VCTTAFGGAGVTVWGCFSLNCKLDLYVFDGILTGQKNRDQTLCPLSRAILMYANVRPHMACIVQNYLQQEAIELLLWPAMSPGMNPVEHLWNCLSLC
jgi:hypothetical protein